MTHSHGGPGGVTTVYVTLALAECGELHSIYVFVHLQLQHFFSQK